MRNRYLSPSFLICALFAAFSVGSAHRTFAAQISFVQSPQSRSQTPPQQGLPPEKKKSLSKYGPEDVFPGANESEENRARGAQARAQATPSPKPQSGYRRTGRNRSRAIPPAPEAATATPTPLVTPTQPVASSPTPAPAAAQSSHTSPSPTAAPVSTDNRLPETNLSRQPALFFVDAKWNILILLGMALAVLGALMHVLVKLREKLRQGSGG